jgi:hypothetical protein
MIYNAIKEKRDVEAFTIPQRKLSWGDWDTMQGAVIFPPSHKAFAIDTSQYMLRVWDMKLPYVQGTMFANLPVQTPLCLARQAPPSGEPLLR